MGLGGSDTDSYCPGTGATAILASCLRSLGKGVGVNYNQTVKAIHTNFNDRRAVALLARLEKYTQELTLLLKYNHWTFLPAEYLFCRLSTREELRDFSFNLNRN